MGLVPVPLKADRFDGKAIEKPRPHERARAGIGFVPQGREIFARLTVRREPAHGTGDAPAPARRIPPQLFELFPVLKQMLGRRGRPVGRTAAAARHRRARWPLARSC